MAKLPAGANQRGSGRRSSFRATHRRLGQRLPVVWTARRRLCHLLGTTAPGRITCPQNYVSAGVTRSLTSAQTTTFEVDRPDRGDRRRRGESNRIDGRWQPGRRCQGGTCRCRSTRAAASRSQWPVGSAQWRTAELPSGGQVFCPQFSTRLRVRQGLAGVGGRRLSGGGGRRPRGFGDAGRRRLEVLGASPGEHAQGQRAPADDCPVIAQPARIAAPAGLDYLELSVRCVGLAVLVVAPAGDGVVRA